MHLSCLLVVAMLGCSGRIRKPPDKPMVPKPAESVENVFPQPDLSLPPEERLVPIGGWVQVAGRIGWIYVDPFSGPSLRWQKSVMVRQPIFRIEWLPSRLKRLTPEEIEGFGLPAVPLWLSKFGPQPEPGFVWGKWRLDPALAPYLDPDDPDMLPVWIHDGPREAIDGEAEQVWVRVIGCEEKACRATVLSSPHALKSVGQGDVIRFEKEPLWDGEHVFLKPD